MKPHQQHYKRIKKQMLIRNKNNLNQYINIKQVIICLWMKVIE